MKKTDVIQLLFKQNFAERGLTTFIPEREKGLAFAPTNIALCKYWGKRDAELNLPMTSSLSVSLPDKGALTEVRVLQDGHDIIILNGQELDPESDFVKRAIAFLNLFRPEKQWHLEMDIKMNLPVAAGLASSACGFASLSAAFNDLFDWRLSHQQLSILARLGSGSAARSLWNGFVEWHAGVQPDGMDCHGESLTHEWPELRLGILTVSNQPKHISSRQAMQQTIDTSVLYTAWPKKVARDMVILRQALKAKNFSLLGGVSESNAIGMHATIVSSWPPICYSLPETLAFKQKIWALRKEGLSLFFTQDAGPNLKLLFLDKDEADVRAHFPEVDVIRLFE